MLPWQRLLLLLMMMMMMMSHSAHTGELLISLQRYPRLSAPSLPLSLPWMGIACILRRKGTEETGIPPGRLAQGFSCSQGKRATVFLC